MSARQVLAEGQPNRSCSSDRDGLTYKLVTNSAQDIYHQGIFSTAGWSLGYEVLARLAPGTRTVLDLGAKSAPLRSRWRRPGSRWWPTRQTRPMCRSWREPATRTGCDRSRSASAPYGIAGQGSNSRPKRLGPGETRAATSRSTPCGSTMTCGDLRPGRRHQDRCGRQRDPSALGSEDNARARPAAHHVRMQPARHGRYRRATSKVCSRRWTAAATASTASSSVSGCWRQGPVRRRFWSRTILATTVPEDRLQELSGLPVRALTPDETLQSLKAEAKKALYHRDDSAIPGKPKLSRIVITTLLLRTPRRTAT